MTKFNVETKIAAVVELLNGTDKKVVAEKFACSVRSLGRWMVALKDEAEAKIKETVKTAPSKVAQARNVLLDILEAGQKTSRKEIIAELIAKVGMTKNGANTYLYNDKLLGQEYNLIKTAGLA